MIKIHCKLNWKWTARTASGKDFYYVQSVDLSGGGGGVCCRRRVSGFISFRVCRISGGPELRSRDGACVVRDRTALDPDDGVWRHRRGSLLWMGGASRCPSRCSPAEVFSAGGLDDCGSGPCRCGRALCVRSRLKRDRTILAAFGLCQTRLFISGKHRL